MSRNTRHELATSSLDAEAIRSVGGAEATSLVFTSSTSPTDMPGMSVTMDIAVGERVLVMFCGAVTVNTASYLDLYVYVDGALQTWAFYWTANNETMVNTQRILVVSPGSRLFRVRWAVRSGAYSARAFDRRLTVIDMKR